MGRFRSCQLHALEPATGGPAAQHAGSSCRGAAPQSDHQQLTFALAAPDAGRRVRLNAGGGLPPLLVGASGVGSQQQRGPRRSSQPLASLTAIAQQHLLPDRAGWQSSSGSAGGGGSKLRLPDRPQQQQQHPGAVNIGLLLQPLFPQQQPHQQGASAAADSNNKPRQAAHQQQQQQQHQVLLQSSQPPAATKPSQPASSRRSKRRGGGGSEDDPSGDNGKQQQQAALLHHKQQQQQVPDHYDQQQQQQRQPGGQEQQQQDHWLLRHGQQAKLLVAGAASAVVSRTAMAPLERVKMDLLLKASTRGALDTALGVLRREGLPGFWKGNGINLLRTAPFKALNFTSFDVYSRALAGLLPEAQQGSGRFLAGALAGITATLVCFPLDVLRTRLMAPWGHKYGGPLRTLQCMAKYEGLGALYAGCVPAVIGMAPSGAVFYGAYDMLKARHLAALNAQPGTAAGSSSSGAAHSQQPQHHLELPVLYTLLYGALAGAAAETFLYPLEVIRRKMQLQSMAAGAAHVAGSAGGAAAAAAAIPPAHLLRSLPGHAAGGLKAAGGALGGLPGGGAAGGLPGAAAMARIAAACAAIVRADGVAGLYAGLLPNMLQVLPSAALSYGTYEAVKSLLGAVQ